MRLFLRRVLFVVFVVPFAVLSLPYRVIFLPLLFVMDVVFWYLFDDDRFEFTTHLFTAWPRWPKERAA